MNTKVVNTSTLSELALDYIVASIEDPDEIRFGAVDWLFRCGDSWSQAGPIIDREGISVTKHAGQDYWCAGSWDARHTAQGPTALIAAMRCYVASRLGDEVAVPEELLL